MRRNLLTALALFAFSMPAWADTAADKAAVAAAFKEMAEAFQNNDLAKTTAYYTDPHFTIRRGKAFTAAEQEAYAKELRGNAPQNYKFVLKQSTAKPLGKDVMLFSYVGDRLDQDGKILGTVASTQIWKRTDKGWKLGMSVSHPPEDYIKLD